jgi:hypothetical protein
MMQVPDVGAFVQGLLPVRLTEEHRVRYRVWLAMDQPGSHGHGFPMDRRLKRSYAVCTWAESRSMMSRR